MMEIERLKSIKHREEIEHQRREAQKQGALVIIDQIKERELERINQQELLEREKQQMAEQIEKLKAEEEIALQKEREKAKKLLMEVEESNREALSEKEKKRREELRLDNEILEYNMAKAKLEEEREIEKKKLQEQKEKDIQKLRDLQERAADRQAEIDALRAKRAFEEQERRHRENERKEREHQLKVMRDMEEARETQFRERERLLAEQARQERDEFARIIRSQKEEAEKDRQINDEKKNILKEHSLQLRTQIIQNEETTKQQRLDYLDLKHNGVVPIADLARFYALAGGLAPVNTHDRIEAAREAGGLSESGARDLLDAYDLIAQTRLQHQAEQVAEGHRPDNFMAPASLSDLQRSHLRDAFMVVKTMQAAASQSVGG